jgi:hypothetical protein
MQRMPMPEPMPTETTPLETVWIDTVRDAGRAFAADCGVVSGDEIGVADAEGGKAVLLIAYPSRESAAEAALAMMTLSRMYALEAGEPAPPSRV